jgi:hypothetical protein
MNEDFIPNRLEAQKVAAERLAQYLFQTYPSSRVALASLSSSEFGLRASFSDSTARIMSSLSYITRSSGPISVIQAIKVAVLALHQSPAQTDAKSIKRILLFIGSEHDVRPPSAFSIAELLQKETVYLDIVVIGTDVANVDILRALVPVDLSANSVFLCVPHSGTVLSDDVLASAIGPGQQMSRVQIPELARRDPELAKALHMSMPNTVSKPKSHGSLSLMLADERPASTQKEVKARRRHDPGEPPPDPAKKRK